MSRRPVLAAAAAAVAATLAGGSFLVAPAGAADRRSEAVADRAVAFVRTQQRPSGGFGDDTSISGSYVGSETVDAVLALGEAAQSTVVYDADAARAAVLAVRTDGRSALDFLDDFSERTDLAAGKYAEITLAAKAVGLDPRRFDPQGDGAVDLIAQIEAKRSPQEFFYSDLLIVTGLFVAGRPVTAGERDAVLAAQRADGGWNYEGSRESSSDSDVDVTGLALEVLIAAGADVDSSAVNEAVAFLAAQQNADGGFHPSYDTGSNPGSTRNAVLGLEAAGRPVVGGCWSKVAVTADDFLRGAQLPTGQVAPATDFTPSQYTSFAVQALIRSFQPVARGALAACPTTGYRLVAADGGVFTHGQATYAGSTGDRVLNKPIVAAADTPSGKGYWLFASDGGVFSFGDADYFGSTGDRTLNQPIVGAAATPTGGGYWLFAADGGVFSFGDAAFLGSTGDRTLNRPIVGAAATNTGRGYWLFASDGGVFTFGDAAFEGSTGDRTLNQPIVAGISSRHGKGYWLVARDGGVFAFGDAAFEGSMGGSALNAPIVTGARSEGDGYYLVASDGGVFAFGAPFLGSEGARPLNSPVVAAAS
jgi:hypothetical protein